jgi:hypothetical protein
MSPSFTGSIMSLTAKNQSVVEKPLADGIDCSFVETITKFGGVCKMNLMDLFIGTSSRSGRYDAIGKCDGLF